MSQQLMSHEHPVEGYMRIYQDDDRVSVILHWPFDLETDEWIDIKNQFRLNDYTSAVVTAIDGQQGKAEGIDGGFIIIERSKNRKTSIEVANSTKGWAARSLRLDIVEPVEKFMTTE